MREHQQRVRGCHLQRQDAVLWPQSLHGNHLRNHEDMIKVYQQFSVYTLNIVLSMIRGVKVALFLCFHERWFRTLQGRFVFFWCFHIAFIFFYGKQQWVFRCLWSWLVSLEHVLLSLSPCSWSRSLSCWQNGRIGWLDVTTYRSFRLCRGWLVFSPVLLGVIVCHTSFMRISRAG